MVRSVALYLARFDEGREELFDDSNVSRSEGDADVTQDTGAHDPVSEEARQNLLEETRAALKYEYDAIIESERAGFLERLKAERSLWAEEEGSRLGAQFCKAIEDLTTRLEADVEKILDPFVVQEVREHVLSSFIEQVRALLADRKNPVIQLSGPKDLLEVVCAKLDSADVATNVMETHGIDVRARLDSTVIETCLQEWINHLRSGD